MRTQNRRYLRRGFDTLQTFAVAVLVVCFVSSFGKEEQVDQPKEQAIDGVSDVQPDDIR